MYHWILSAIIQNINVMTSFRLVKRAFTRILKSSSFWFQTKVDHMASHFFKLALTKATNMDYKHPDICGLFSWTTMWELSGCQWADSRVQCGARWVINSVSHRRWLTLSLSSFSLSALASLSFFSISTRSNRVGLQEELYSVNQRKC